MSTFGKVVGTLTSVTVTGFNSLANVTYVASAEIDFTSAKPLDGLLQVSVTPGTVSGNTQLKCFAIVSLDGTNFTTGPTSGTTTTREPVLYRLGDIPLTSSTQEIKTFSLLRQLGFVPKKIKVVFFNDSGAALAGSGNALDVSMVTGDFTA